MEHTSQDGHAGPGRTLGAEEALDKVRSDLAHAARVMSLGSALEPRSPTRSTSR